MASIDDLPAEILVKIFNYLSFKEVQKNCLNTSKRWQEIVAEHILSSEIKIHMALDPGFKTCLLRNGWTPEINDTKAIANAWNEYLPYRTKFLALDSFESDKWGIFYYEDEEDDDNEDKIFNRIPWAEFFDLNDPDFRPVLTHNRPIRQPTYVGLVEKHKILTCNDKCKVGRFYDDILEEIDVFDKPRSRSHPVRGIRIDESKFWMIMGNGETHVVSYENGTMSKSPGPNISDHLMPVFCMVQYDTSTIYMFFDNTVKTVIVDLVQNSVKFGPNMKLAKRNQQCGKMMINGRVILVVMEGFGRRIVEVLDPLSSEGWRQGPRNVEDLPALKELQIPPQHFLPPNYHQIVGLPQGSMIFPDEFKTFLVTSPNGKGIIAYAYHNYDRFPYWRELTGDSIDTLKWSILPQMPRLKVRPDQWIISIPDNKDLVKKLKNIKMLEMKAVIRETETYLVDVESVMQKMKSKLEALEVERKGALDQVKKLNNAVKVLEKIEG